MLWIQYINFDTVKPHPIQLYNKLLSRIRRKREKKSKQVCWIKMFCKEDWLMVLLLAFIILSIPNTNSVAVSVSKIEYALHSSTHNLLCLCTNVSVYLSVLTLSPWIWMRQWKFSCDEKVDVIFQDAIQWWQFTNTFIMDEICI